MCARCSVTSRWIDGRESAESPPGWSASNGIAHCLNCRRELAGEAEALNAPGTADGRLRAHAVGRIKFEISRFPDRPDTRIARACHVPVATVREVRDLLGAYQTSPV